MAAPETWTPPRFLGRDGGRDCALRLRSFRAAHLLAPCPGLSGVRHRRGGGHNSPTTPPPRTGSDSLRRMEG